MELKPATTYRTQLDKLKSRNCIVVDESFCLSVLSSINYYRFSAYYLPFKQPDDTYFPNTTFERVYGIYEFDRKMRGILFSALEEIEVKLRTKLAYYHSHMYGPDGYTFEYNFNLKHDHQSMMTHIDSEIENNANLLFVKHHRANYDSKFPLWVVMELFSFGMLSYFYADMLQSDQRNIANVDFGLDNAVLRSWLRCCTDLRNICAHGGRLYYRKFSTTPKTPAGTSTLSNRLFDMILIIKTLYPSESKWNTEVLPSVSALINEYMGIIKLNHIGFPEKWETALAR